MGKTTPAFHAQKGAWRRLCRNRAAVVSIGLLTFVALAAIFGPFCFPKGYSETGPIQFGPPSWEHWFGTDLLGRDLLYRVIVGARISLLVGLAGAAISLFIGTSYGMIAGYFGGKIDNRMMRFVDIFYAIPRLIVVILFISAFDRPLQHFLMAHFDGTFLGWTARYSKILMLVISLGLIEWLTMARVVRGQVLALKSMQYVTAARSLGQSHVGILLRHLLPNLAGIVVVYLTLTIPAVIIDESFLSFLGLGTDASQASWGTLLSDGAQVINPVRSNWWLLVFPAVVMSLTLLSFNFIGDGLRDAVDPRDRR